MPSSDRNAVALALALALSRVPRRIGARASPAARRITGRERASGGEPARVGERRNVRIPPRIHLHNGNYRCHLVKRLLLDDNVTDKLTSCHLGRNVAASSGRQPS
ncbi:hypothetical protein J3A78_000307 [Streptomyces sp. PvR006]|nr:hypothetical protein [Streptomyces sp. PvR006]